MKEPISFALTEDKQLALVTPNIKEPFMINALVTEELIHFLIAMRAEMLPRRTATDPFAGTQLLSSPNMRWYVAPSAGGVQLCLGHPGLGWIGMPLDREMATKLMNHLQDFLSQ